MVSDEWRVANGGSPVAPLAGRRDGGEPSSPPCATATRLAILLLCLWHLTSAPCPARQVQEGDAFAAIRSTSAVMASATLLSAGQPFAAAALLGVASRNAEWDTLTEDPVSRVASAPGAGLLVDRDLLAGVEDGAPVRSADQNYYEFRAYNYLLVRAHNAPADSLAKAARRDLSFAHLFEEPAKYRGELIHIEGTLRRLRRFDAARMAAKQGVPTIYEGWIFGDVYYNNPFCVIASEIDPRLTIGERLDRRVSFDGYFFKRYRYKAGDTWRDAPLLIGRIIEAQNVPGDAEESMWSFNRLGLPSLVALLAGSILLCIGLAWWFRRGDRQVRRRLETLRTAPFAETGEGAESQSTNHGGHGETR